MLNSTQRLKIQLMTNGMAVSTGARAALSREAESRPLTLAEYASTSGIALELEGQIWVNAPIADHNPNFVAATPHRLEHRADEFWVCSGRDEVRARPVPVPAFHDQENDDGEPFTDYAVTHTDRVRISPIGGCSFACAFCDLPFKMRYRRKTIKGLVDAVRRALADEVLPARHVLISGGVPAGEDWEWQNQAYGAVAEAFPDVDVDVMMVPVPGLLDARRLRDLGIHGLSLNLELYDLERARRIMPRKAGIPRQHWLDFIEDAVDVFGPGRIRSLVLVGIEPLEETLKAVQALAERGCEPVLSPFRPDPATPMRDHPPPSVEVLAEVYERSVEITRRAGARLGPRCLPCMHNTLTFPEDAVDDGSAWPGS
ncbi:MAG: radical SAM protein [bacterium]|nr:radical SAM protein [bacterium]